MILVNKSITYINDLKGCSIIKGKLAYKMSVKDFQDIYNVYSAYILFLDYNNLQEFE